MLTDIRNNELENSSTEINCYVISLKRESSKTEPTEPDPAAECEPAGGSSRHLDEGWGRLWERCGTPEGMSRGLCMRTLRTGPAGPA